MKKVLFAATVYHHLATFHKPFIKNFQDKGFEVHAIGNNSMGRKIELEEMKVVCHDINFNRNPLSSKNVYSLKELQTLFEQHVFQIIHVHTPIAAFLTRYVAKKNHGSMIYTAHGFHFFKGASIKNWLLFYPAEKLATKWTDGLIVMNDEDLRIGKKLGYIEGESLFTVHGVGVNLSEFNEKQTKYLNNDVRDELNISQDSMIISCIAELSKRKNQIFLLENWKSIMSFHSDIHLLLIGEGEEKSKLEKYIKDNKIENVHFLGFRKDVPAIIAQSNIVTLVSKHEGLPKCLMEAMALGKPIITTSVRGSKDLVMNGVNGFTVELRDSKKLVQSFGELVKDKKLREKFGEVGKMEIQAYGLKKVIKEMDLIYSKFYKY